MLANVYMNRFLKHWRLTGRHEAFRAHVVAYADDFVILSSTLAKNLPVHRAREMWNMGSFSTIS